MANAVELRDVVALTGAYPALAGVDLVVAPGEVVLVRGPNGAGKTSLLRVCAGLLPISSGSAFVLGCDLSEDRRAVRRRVGMLGHASFLYDDLSVLENVVFALRAARGPVHRAGPVLERFGLAGRLCDVPCGRLSAGQRRRVALAVLAAREPELWLLDEPHAGLDAAGRDLLDETVATAAAHGATVLFASHEADRPVALADRVVAVAGGRIVGETAGRAAVGARGDAKGRCGVA